MATRRWTPAAILQVAAGLFLAVLVTARPAPAATLRVPPGPDTLRRAIAAAHPGETLQLDAGRYGGGFIIDRRLTISGRPDSIVDGGGIGRVITVAAPGVVVRGMTVVNSGEDLAVEDSGVFVTAEGDGALIEDNRLEHNLIGIYLKGPDAAVVRNNRIVGRRDLHMSERGNGIHLWYTPGSVIEGNRVRYGRDGIFVMTSRDNVFRNNRFRDLRFAIHYMYTNDSEVIGNVSRSNHVGFALMFSHGLNVDGNVSDGDRDRGVFLNYTNNSRITNNSVRGGVEKCLFIYNANMNRISGNRLEGCRIGIHFTAGSERNEIFGNAFIDNRTQVKYVGTRYIEWSLNGRGNYWSDNPAFDLDNDGIADQPHRPNDLVDQVVWKHPLAKLLLNSPAVHLLRWAQAEFPAIHPGGVTDSAPLMAPPATDG